ncbi:MAG: hypothetical protein ACPLYD_16835, partial [Anaerolineae bacterium]
MTGERETGAGTTELTANNVAWTIKLEFNHIHIANALTVPHIRVPKSEALPLRPGKIRPEPDLIARWLKRIVYWRLICIPIPADEVHPEGPEGSAAAVGIGDAAGVSGAHLP